MSSRFALLALLVAPTFAATACATGDSSPTTPAGDSSIIDAKGGDGSLTDTSMNPDDSASSETLDDTSGDDTSMSSSDTGPSGETSTDAGSDTGPADTGPADTGTTTGDTGTPFNDAGRPPGCDLSVPTGQTFGSTMVGCPGKVTWDQRGGLCIGGWTACTSSEWAALHGTKTPAFDYWVDENLKYSGSSTACYASPTIGNSCASAPFHLCSNVGVDGEGNNCNWANCGLGATTPDQYFGGGCTNSTAGTACCLPPCASGAPTETFTNGVFGCAGSVPYANRTNLCGNGYRACTAAEWMAGFNGVAPTHIYWTEDPLKWGGAGPNSCTVSLTTGNDCGADPMRVCGASTDAEGNVCNWTGCGYEATTPNDYFGGCSGNTNAGTLCCPQ